MQTTKRTGWVNHGVKDSESIADHMYRMAVMAIISGDLPGVNKDRCVVCTTLWRGGLKENCLELWRCILFVSMVEFPWWALLSFFLSSLSLPPFVTLQVCENGSCAWYCWRYVTYIKWWLSAVMVRLHLVLCIWNTNLVTQVMMPIFTKC